MCFDGFQEIADAETARRGDRNGIAAGKVIELVDIVFEFCEAVHLIDREHHGLLCAAQHVRDPVVRIRDTGSHIGQKDNHIRRIYGDLRLLAHGDEELVSRLRLDAAGVNQREVAIKPAAVRINSIPGNAGNVFDNRNRLSRNRIEERGFSRIRPSDDSDDWFTHFLLLLKAQGVQPL